MAISPNKQQLAAAGNLQIRLFELGSNNLQPVSSKKLTSNPRLYLVDQTGTKAM